MHVTNVCFFLLLILGFSSATAAADTIDLSDVGEVRIDNTGSPEAQQAFLHGLAQLHNFEFDFAAADFREAQRIDPEFALAYWGEAMSHNHPIWMQQDRDAALQILNQYAPSATARQTKAVTELERNLLAAIDILYGDGEKQARDDLYSAEMARLFARYPDNVEIASFYALAIMGSAHEGRDFGLYMQAAAILQSFRNDYPRHPGVVHYLIHATDDPIHAPLGLKAAQAYADIAPNAAHAQHMTTHIFLALGDWEGVINANTRATDLMNANRARRGLDPTGCGHYPSWLMYGHLQLGHRDEALRIMNLCYDRVSEASSGNTASYYPWQRALYLFDTGQWDGEVASMKPVLGERLNSQNLIVDGWIAIKTGDIKGAREALKTAQAAHRSQKEKMRDGAAPENDRYQKLPVVNLMQLEAQILLATDNREAGVDLLRKAVDVELELPYGFGPPRPAKPSLELLGETLVTLGRYAEAEAVLQKTLTRTPNKALGLLALEKAKAGMQVVISTD